MGVSGVLSACLNNVAWSEHVGSNFFHALQVCHSLSVSGRWQVGDGISGTTCQEQEAEEADRRRVHFGLRSVTNHTMSCTSSDLHHGQLDMFSSDPRYHMAILPCMSLPLPSGIS